MRGLFCMRLWVGFHSLLESGIITQQQLRTSPVDRIISLALLFRKFHKWEIRFPIPTCVVGSGFGFKFILFVSSLLIIVMPWMLLGKYDINNKE